MPPMLSLLSVLALARRPQMALVFVRQQIVGGQQPPCAERKLGYAGAHLLTLPSDEHARQPASGKHRRKASSSQESNNHVLSGRSGGGQEGVRRGSGGGQEGS
eukprot:558537-Prorocentrum_minimum.AAC.3